MFPAFHNQQKPDVVIEDSQGNLLPLTIQVTRFRAVRMPVTSQEVENARIFVQTQVENQIFHSDCIEIPLITESIFNPRLRSQGPSHRDKNTYPFVGYVVGVYGFQRPLLFAQGISFWTKSTKSVLGKQALLARAYEAALFQMKNAIFEDPIDLYDLDRTLDRLAIAHYIGLKVKRQVSTKGGQRDHARYRNMVQQQEDRLGHPENWSEELFTGEAIFGAILSSSTPEEEDSQFGGLVEVFVPDLPTA